MRKPTLAFNYHVEINPNRRNQMGKLPTMNCKGLCHESCGPIMMSPVEFQKLRDLVGEKIQGAPVSDGNILVTNFNRQTLSCPLLTSDKKCSVYADRPMICRLWGMVKKMRCPHGCKPSRWIGREESYRFLDAAALPSTARHTELPR